jgi:hypothetical protein
MWLEFTRQGRRRQRQWRQRIRERGWWWGVIELLAVMGLLQRRGVKSKDYYRRYILSPSIIVLVRGDLITFRSDILPELVACRSSGRSIHPLNPGIISSITHLFPPLSLEINYRSVFPVPRNVSLKAHTQHTHTPQFDAISRMGLVYQSKKTCFNFWTIYCPARHRPHEEK